MITSLKEKISCKQKNIGFSIHQPTSFFFVNTEPAQVDVIHFIKHQLAKIIQNNKILNCQLRIRIV